jgi:hypothetical protein
MASPGLKRALWSALVLVALAAASVGAMHYLDGRARVFSTEAWRGAERGGYARGGMVPDLLARHRLVGMTRAALVALLGPPQQTRADGRQLVYDLGVPDNGLAFDPDLLIITLDAEDRVVRHALVGG